MRAKCLICWWGNPNSSHFQMGTGLQIIWALNRGAATRGRPQAEPLQGREELQEIVQARLDLAGVRRGLEVPGVGEGVPPHRGPGRQGYQVAQQRAADVEPEQPPVLEVVGKEEPEVAERFQREVVIAHPAGREVEGAVLPLPEGDLGPPDAQ